MVQSHYEAHTEVCTSINRFLGLRIENHDARTQSPRFSAGRLYSWPLVDAGSDLERTKRRAAHPGRVFRGHVSYENTYSSSCWARMLG